MHATLAYHWARMIELLHCIEVITELLDDPDILSGERMASGVRQRHKHLPPTPLLLTHVVLHDRVAAGLPVPLQLDSTHAARSPKRASRRSASGPMKLSPTAGRPSRRRAA